MANIKLKEDIFMKLRAINRLGAQGLISSIQREKGWMLRMMLNPVVFIEKM